MPWLLKQKNKRKNKRYRFSTWKSTTKKMMKRGVMSPKHSRGSRTVVRMWAGDEGMFITMCEWMSTYYSTVVALFFPFSSIYIPMTLEIESSAVCMRLHECERVSVALVKVKVYFKREAALESHVVLHRGGRGGGVLDSDVWTDSDPLECCVRVRVCVCVSVCVCVWMNGLLMNVPVCPTLFLNEHSCTLSEFFLFIFFCSSSSVAMSLFTSVA